MPELTETTVRYLYATSWLPTETTEATVAVPGGSTKAIDATGLVAVKRRLFKKIVFTDVAAVESLRERRGDSL